MRFPSLVVVLLALVAVAPAGAVEARAPSIVPMSEMADAYADAFRLEPPPAHMGAEERAEWLWAQRPALGRTPESWVSKAREDFAFEAPREVRRADLVAQVVRVYLLTGAPVTFDTLTAIVSAADALPTGLRSSFGGLVATVADAYEDQLPIASAVAGRIAAGFEVTEPLVTTTERDAMTARQASLVRALAGFEAAAAGTAAAFADPEGLIVLGDTTDDSYERSGMFPDPVLLVDLGGADTYRNSAGGACSAWTSGESWLVCNGLAVSVVADLDPTSDDRYLYDGPASAVQGAGGPGGLGLLVDVGGDDTYDARMTRSVNPFFQYVDGGAQGFAYGGSGALVDLAGADTYSFDVFGVGGRSIWALGQGFGAAGSAGFILDAAGDDAWLSTAKASVNNGFQGVYTVGTGFYGGVGVFVELGAGDDTYYAVAIAPTVDFYAVGFGAFGGLGIAFEDGGNDDYYTAEVATSSPFINPLLNCAYGTASFGGVGVMYDVDGDDVYYGGSFAPPGYGATVMDSGFGGPGQAYGLFIDTGGDDRYEMEADGSYTMIIGRGEWQPGLQAGDILGAPLGHNTWGTFVDIGGTDTYIGGYGANDQAWVFGVDRAA